MAVTATNADGTVKTKLSNQQATVGPTLTSSSTPENDDAVGQLQDKLAKDLVRIFKLLSDETRLRILHSLSQAEELHVRALCDLLKLSQPAVSHHLGMLRNASIVEPRRDGKHNFYRILPGNFQRLLTLIFDGIPESELAVRFQDLNLGGNHRPLQPR
ncbi:MAG: metalloregulator ArsR/SmtB family transcription factor [Planctomycetales bacterium]